ncbi:MAG: GNAT family N-acetyltransferase [Actinomycetota bacterium]
MRNATHAKGAAMQIAERWRTGDAAGDATRDRTGDPARTGGNVRGREHVLLVDGSLLELRRLTGADEPGLRRFYAALSPATLHRRFMTPLPRLPEPTLAYLSETGHLHREVVVATFGGRIVAEARYHRVRGTDAAEVAIVVADAWQGRGIGRALSGHLARAAAWRGVTSFTGSMLADNRPALRLLKSLAPQADRRIRSGELEFRALVPP